jgi:hypothetical protein
VQGLSSPTPLTLCQLATSSCAESHHYSPLGCFSLFNLSVLEDFACGAMQASLAVVAQKQHLLL